MLTRQGAVFHFRRKVPLAVRPVIGKTEIWCSLGTSNATQARCRAGVLYAAVERVFDVAKKVIKTPASLEEQERAVLEATVDELERLLAAQRQLADLKKEQAELQEVTAALRAAEERAALVQRLGRAADIAQRADALRVGELQGRKQAEAVAVEARKAAERADAVVENLATAAAVVQAQMRDPGALASTLVEEHLQNRLTVDKITNQVANQERGTITRFIEVAGDRPMGTYRRADITRFISKLRKLPAVYGRSPRDAELSVDQLIARADEGGLKRLSDKTAKRHISALARFLQFAVDEGHMTATEMKDAIHAHRFRTNGVAADKRDAWTKDELIALFGSPVWTGCHRTMRSQPGPHIIRDAKFWIPLLGLYHGARLEEFADLYRRDIHLDGSTWAISIKPSQELDEKGQVIRERRLKTANSARTIPLHPELIRIGFLQYVEQVAPRPDMPLFADLEPQGADGKRGPRFTRWFVEYRRAVGVYRAGVGAHAFRHTAITRISDRITTYGQKKMRDYMMGHAPNEVVTTETEGDVTYDKGRGLEMCAETLSLLQYPELDLSHLYGDGAVRSRTTPT